MNKNDFNNIRVMIRSLWKEAINSEPAYDAWYNSLKKYDYYLIKDAVEAYIRIGKFEPKPADIIAQIKAPERKSSFDPSPKYEEINGKRKRVFTCLRCRDSGMMTWDDADGHAIGLPCDCPAGHYYFRWGWLTVEEQQDFIKEHGHHGEIVGENWYNMQPQRR